MTGKNRFDLEQEILDCWNVVKDIEDVIDICEEGSIEDVIEALNGMRVLYNRKFSKTFDTFEACLAKREFKNE